MTKFKVGAQLFTCRSTCQTIEGVAQTFRKIKQIGSVSSHLYYLLLSKGLIERNERTEKMAIPHPEIVNLRYDSQRSKIDDIPEDLHIPLKEIFLQYADGSVRFEKRKWVEC